jgi:hypothetical protein
MAAVAPRATVRLPLQNRKARRADTITLAPLRSTWREWNPSEEPLKNLNLASPSKAISLKFFNAPAQELLSGSVSLFARVLRLVPGFAWCQALF